MHFLLTLIIQIAVILVTARLVGWVFRKFHQPQVVGEMVAGIILGPSLLGWIAPGVSAALFPPESLRYLNALSQIGLLLFMFLIGLELDPKLLRGRTYTAIVTGHASIFVPFSLGIVLAYYLHPVFSNPSVRFIEFALFMGAAMSITAFPVLARILSERNLLRTQMGALTIASAAVNDVAAWCILAVIITLVRAIEANTPLWVTLAGSGIYIFLMLFPVRRGLSRLEAYYRNRGRITQDMVGFILLLLLASAWATEWLGIHALFGAFVIGVVMPNDHRFVHDLTEKLEDLTVVLLLPLFFAFTGLHTRIGLLNEAVMWGYFGVIMLAAVAGKFGGAFLAARLTALPWREAGALGILMNTRGLMELVILAIGLQYGIISPPVFAMMVLMAIATTLMTTPLLEWIYPTSLARREVAEEPYREKKYTVLIPVSLPSSGPGLLQVASALAPPLQSEIYALHLLRAGDLSLSDFPGAELPLPNESLQPLLDAAMQKGIPVRPLSFVSRDPAKDITDVAHVKRTDLIVMGWHKPVVSRSILSGTVYDIMRHARMDVCVYLERQFRPWKRILVPFRRGAHDRAALELARRLALHGNVEVTILHVTEPKNDQSAAGSPPSPGGQITGGREVAEDPFQGAKMSESFSSERVHLQVVESNDPLGVAVKVACRSFDLVIVGVSEFWGLEPVLFSNRHERLARECPASLLMVRKYIPEKQS